MVLDKDVTELLFILFFSSPARDRGGLLVASRKRVLWGLDCDRGEQRRTLGGVEDGQFRSLFVTSARRARF